MKTSKQKETKSKIDSKKRAACIKKHDIISTSICSIIAIFSLFFVLSFTSCKKQLDKKIEFYDGFDKDLTTIRITHKLVSPKINASSMEALKAAERIFKNIEFIGMKKQQVLELLGDPETISDYGIEMKKNQDSPLLYRFDFGFGGSEYQLYFIDGKVIEVKIVRFS